MDSAVNSTTDQRTVSLFEVNFAYRLAGKHTEGRLAALEVTIPPRTLVKPHQHSKEDEFSVICPEPSGLASETRPTRRSRLAPR
jgi:hypothetical protein